MQPSSRQPQVTSKVSDIRLRTRRGRSRHAVSSTNSDREMQSRRDGMKGSRVPPSLHPSIPLSLFVLALLPLAAGCSEADKRKWQAHTPEQNFHDALQSPQGDIRREAVIAIGESRYATREDAFHVLDAVARTDPISQVRCIAIRSLGSYTDDRPVRPLLQILQANGTSKDALPGDDDVRWETASTLLAMERKGVLKGDERDTARDVFIKLLESDPSRCVKIVSTEALGRFKDRRVFHPLFVALRDKDFAIADAAERSLIALTGVRHDYDADAWEKWVAAAPDPFANAGHLPPASRPAGPSWFDKQMDAWRRGLKSGNVKQADDDSRRGSPPG
jgi:HEAT repeat protein